MHDQLKDKVVAITGASSGIGLATSHMMAARGAKLSLADVNEAGLETAKKSILAATPSAEIITFPVDVRKWAQVEAWISKTSEHFGRLDGAVNLAGVVPKDIGLDKGGIDQLDEAEYDFIMGVNTLGVALCMKAQVPKMGKGGSIVNASSIAGLIGRSKNSIYSASKHAVMGLTRSAAKEVGVKGIRVNAINP